MRSGIASASSLRRFEYESQILARLRHPNIAQVYEAGTHDDGTGPVPYFAMEYIPGAKTLTDYARDKRLDVRQRLELFTKVCGAVSHGHQNGIIHRDLKPGNILVESSGEPKVIDFGVARATDSDMAVTTLHTDVGQLIGTLQYMSPEQFEADPHAMDTRSDVYALGVVLFELLCDQLPYDVSKVAVYEAALVIREEPPARPSTFNRTLRGDLETITLKALEKDRSRRYQSSSDLAADIHRYLNDDPVAARPASALYQLRKFSRRNKAIVGGVTVAFAALLVGTIVATWQAVHARREADRALNIKGFLGDVIAGTDPYVYGRKLTTEDVLDQALMRLDQQFVDEPELRAEVRTLIGISFFSMSEYSKSIEQLRVALETRRQILGADHPETLETEHHLGYALLWDGQVAESEDVLLRVVDARERVLGADHKDTLWSMSVFGHALAYHGKYEEAEESGRRAADGLARALGDDNELTLHARHKQGAILRMGGSMADAIEVARTARALSRKAMGEEHPLTIQITNSLGGYLSMNGHWNEGEPHLRWSLETQRRLFGDNDAMTLDMMDAFGYRLYRNGRQEDGEALIRQAVDGYRRVLGADNLATGYVEQRLSRIEWNLGIAPGP